MPDAPAPAAAPCGGCAVSRRAFVSAAAAVVASAALTACGADAGTAPGDSPPPTNVLPAGITIAGNTITVDLAVRNDLTEAPGLVVILGRTARDVLLVRSVVGSTVTYRAFGASCPHAGNRGAWNDLISGDNEIVCQAHGSTFNRATGAVTGGIASRGLTTVPSTRSGTTWTINAG